MGRTRGAYATRSHGLGTVSRVQITRISSEKLSQQFGTFGRGEENGETCDLG